MVQILAVLAQTATETDTAPWWGVPVLAGGFLVVGALIAFISTRSSDIRRAKREEARRWDAEIRDLGATFLAAADIVLENIQDHQTISKSPTIRSVVDPVDGKTKRQIDVVLTTKKVARKEARKAMHELSFVAPDKVMIKVRRHLINTLGADILENANEKETKDIIASSRKEVVNAIREAIGLKAAQLDKQTWLRRLRTKWGKFRESKKKPKE